MPCRARIVAYCLQVFAGLLIAQTALAQAWPAPIRSLEDKGVTIVKEFDAPGGLTGFAARVGNRPIALYLTPDGQHVIIGTLLDSDGANLTQPQLDAAITRPSRQQAWPLLEKANWIADGADGAPRVIYVFTDPNCPYCHRFYQIARPWVAAGKVQLRHIPVGILKPSSPGKAAALLGADDPEQAMHKHENNYRRGGIAPLDKPPQKLRQQVAANNQLMAQLGIHGTPGIFYRDDDNKVEVQQGVPSGASLKKILGPK